MFATGHRAGYTVNIMRSFRITTIYHYEISIIWSHVLQRFYKIGYEHSGQIMFFSASDRKQLKGLAQKKHESPLTEISSGLQGCHSSWKNQYSSRFQANPGDAANVTWCSPVAVFYCRCTSQIRDYKTKLFPH